MLPIYSEIASLKAEIIAALNETKKGKKIGFQIKQKIILGQFWYWWCLF